MAKINLLPQSQWRKLSDALMPYRQELYFLLLALETPEKLKAIYYEQDQDHLVAVYVIRQSGKAHFHHLGPVGDHWIAFLKQRPNMALLLHSRVYDLIKPHIGDHTLKETSQVMTRQQANSQLETANTCTDLCADDLPDIKQFYNHHMKGALSLNAMQANFLKGGFGSLCLSQGHLVGVAQVGGVNHNQAYVFGVVVDPHYRAQGYGSQLMDHLLSQSDAKGLNLYMLTDNPKAVSLYEQKGFATSGFMYQLTLESTR